MIQYFQQPTKKHDRGRLVTEYEIGDWVLFRSIASRNNDSPHGMDAEVIAFDASDAFLGDDARILILRLKDGQEFRNRLREWEVTNNTYVTVQSQNVRIRPELDMFMKPREEWETR